MVLLERDGPSALAEVVPEPLHEPAEADVRVRLRLHDVQQGREHVAHPLHVGCVGVVDGVRGQHVEEGARVRVVVLPRVEGVEAVGAAGVLSHHIDHV